MPKSRFSLLRPRQSILYTHKFRFRGRIHFSRTRVRATHTQRKLCDSIEKVFPNSLDGEDEEKNIVPQAYWNERLDSAFVAIKASDGISETFLD